MRCSRLRLQEDAEECMGADEFRMVCKISKAIATPNQPDESLKLHGVLLQVCARIVISHKFQKL